MALTSKIEPSRFQYHLQLWGDLIYGSKDELQALGLAQGMAFPGEPGGPRRELKVIDPRGFPCRIKQAEHHGTGQFLASIPFPGREYQDRPVEDFAPGVTVERLWYADCYRGASDALIKAGLVRADQFPGAPGRGKTVAKFLADGTPAPLGCCGLTLGPGGMVISRKTTRLFEVCVRIDIDEENRRHEADLRERAKYERRMAAMPRPRPLVAAPREAAAQARRAQLRLVWSRPAPGFAIRNIDNS